MSAGSVHKKPYISVIIPARNEEKYITKCLQSLITQTLEKDSYEIILVDGLSTDKTRDLAEEVLSKSGVNYKILTNEKRNPASGMNVGLAAARGQYIARCDAHTAYSHDFLEMALKVLEEKNADFAGGHQIPVPSTFLEKVITIFMLSFTGTGGAAFRKPHAEGWSDTAYMGVYRRRVFETLGGFDESLYGAEDDTFHWKMVKEGFRIYLSPRIKSEYIPSGNFFQHVRRFFRYGFAKGTASLRYKKFKPVRQFIPSLFALYVASLPAGLIFLPHPFNILYLIPAGAYMFLLLGTVAGWMRKFFLPSLAVPLLFPVFHLAYGTGFLTGFFRELYNSMVHPR